MGREQAIKTGGLERQAGIFARRRLVERKERDGFDEGFEGFGQRRLAQLRSQCDLRQADDRNADFTGRAFGDAAVHRRGGIDHGVDRAVGVDQIADHAFVAASSAAFRAAIVLGLSSNSRNSGGKGLSQGALPAKPLTSIFALAFSTGSKRNLPCSSRTTISAPASSPSAFGSRSATELPDLNTLARYSFVIAISVYTYCIYYATKAASTTMPSARSEEHTSELQSLMRISYAVFCLKKKKQKK